MAGLTDRLTRRNFLRVGVATGFVGLAGCGESGGGTGPPDAFRSVTVEGNFLVVELVSDHELSKINLIAPDGTLYDQHRPATGERTVRFRLVELDPVLPKHYTPGDYELVAVDGERTESRSIELQPDLRIREIEQATDSQARLGVVLENIGTAPTWVFDIAYEDSPYAGTNDDLVSNPAIPYLHKPKSSTERILRPGEQRTFVGLNNPLRFVDTDAPVATCDDSFEMVVIVGVASGDPLRKQIVVTADGPATSWRLGNGYTCDNVSIEMSERDTVQDIEEFYR